jgi:hypothetical protein
MAEVAKLVDLATLVPGSASDAAGGSAQGHPVYHDVLCLPAGRSMLAQ